MAMAIVSAPTTFHGLRVPHSSFLRATKRTFLKCRCSAAAAADNNLDVQQFVNEDLEARGRPLYLTRVASRYNNIVIVEVPRDSPSELAGARLLILDDTGNVHSVYQTNSKWVGSYWDDFSSLPPIIPLGPIAILGLGGGTAARLLLHLWPERELVGWEIDDILIDKARLYLGLSELEGGNDNGGGLKVHIGDAFSTHDDPEGGFAGIIVDLFADGKVLPTLNEAETWFQLKKRLREGGRIMINCVEENVRSEKEHPVLSAMLQAFPNEVNWRSLDQVKNTMAFTGPLPNLKDWSERVPERLKQGTLNWKNLN